MHMLLRATSRASFHTARVLCNEYPVSRGSGRPLTAFFRFMKDVRAEIVDSNPGSSTTEIAKLVGNKWKQLDETSRNKYKEEYNEAMKLFKEKIADKLP